MSKKIVMTKREAVKEHEELTNTLRHPTPAKMAKEASKQGKELREYKRK